MKKRFLSLLCAAVLCTMAGCGGTPSSSAAPSNSSTPSANSSSAGKEASATSNGQTTLNILWWGSQTRHDLTTKMLEKFQELNPDIEVVMDYSDWGGYWTKLPAQVAGGQTPDVFQMDYAYLSQYANNGVLAELDSYIADGSLNMSDVAENIIKSGSVNGKVYAISTGTNAPVMLYRNDILEELNLSLPMNPTMSEYTAVSKAVYEATGLRDTFIVDCSDVIFRQHLRNYGLNLYNDDATALGFDDPRYLVNMWKLALQAQEEGWGLMPGEGTAVSAFDSMVMDAWSRFQNSNELQAYRDSTGKDIRMVMLPSMDDGTTPATFLKPAMFWCVGADSNVKDAAIRFIDFFTNSPECFDIVGIERAVPISSKMREHVTPSLDEVGKEVVQFIDYVSQPDKSSPLMNADPEVHQTIGELMSQYSEQVRYGELTDLEAAAKQFMEEANKIIADGVKAE